MQEIKVNQKTKNIPLYPKDTNTLKVLAPFVTLPLSPLLCVLWWWRRSRARWSTAPTTRNAGLGSRRWLQWLCLDYMILGITRISRYESIENSAQLRLCSAWLSLSIEIKGLESISLHKNFTFWEYHIFQWFVLVHYFPSCGSLSLREVS